MSRRELLAYDRMLSQYLVKETLLPKLVGEVEKDKNHLMQLQQMGDRSREHKDEDFIKVLKTQNN